MDHLAVIDNEDDGGGPFQFRAGPPPDEGPRMLPLWFLLLALGAFLILGACSWAVLDAVADALTY